MHKVFNWHKASIKRYVPKRPHKPSSHRLGRRSLYPFGIPQLTPWSVYVHPRNHA